MDILEDEGMTLTYCTKEAPNQDADQHTMELVDRADNDSYFIYRCPNCGLITKE